MGTEPHIGKRPPRYTFMLNPHPHLKLSKCPRCRKLTFPRKFALLVHGTGCPPLLQGKTCKFCSKCQLIIAQQDELEAQLALSFQKVAPHLIGNDYLVLGTADLTTFKQGLRDQPSPLGAAIDHIMAFKAHRNLDIDPGGWQPRDAPPRIVTAAQAAATLSTPWKQRGKQQPQPGLPEAGRH